MLWLNVAPCVPLSRTALAAVLEPSRKKFVNCKRPGSIGTTRWSNQAGHLNPQPSGMIWQILYPVILVTFGFVFVQAFRGKVGWHVTLPFAVNLLANLVFTPIQFGLRNMPLAAVDILIVWASIIWCMVAIWQSYKWVAVAQVPYFVWYRSLPCCNCALRFGIGASRSQNFVRITQQSHDQASG